MHIRPISARRSLRPRRGSLAFALLAGSLSMMPGTARPTVAEQRARLPPAATCRDEVTGIWKSHDFDERYQDWTIFTLDIHRVEGSETALEGSITNHTWYADKRFSEPPACAGSLEYFVSMNALGTFSDGFIQFGGVGEWRLDDVPCGRFTMGYNLDNFSGSIDPDLQEFQSVNNDGGRAINDPTVFRRVSCDQDEQAKGPQVVLKPPPFFPPEDETEAEGCGVR